jgi:hypothetical protein
MDLNDFFEIRALHEIKNDITVRKAVSELQHEAKRELDFIDQQFRVLTNLMKKKHENHR